MIRNEHIIKAYKPYFECIKDVVAHATKPLADKKSELTNQDTSTRNATTRIA